MKKVQIFTDGSSLGNPGPGGWCALLRYNEHEKILKGGKAETTNNEMEIKAVLEGLKALKEPCEVDLYSDSQYVVKAISEWIYNWQKNNWRNASKKEIAHREMWEEIYNLLQKHKVNPIWIKAHAGHTENELCDKIAKKEAQKFSE
ncbi:ribonuclease HI [Persephonella sp.]|uniref:ribonuclease HI n=1 Tax=Persephonella sp. TaxID=2060922 RepID=UPI002606ED18|nr:ribonuclease HI [Persephonella sp.]